MIAEVLFSLAVATTQCENAALDFPAMIDGGGQPKSAVAGDFDTDGRLDVAVGGPAGVILLKGDGRGGFASRKVLSTAPATEVFKVNGDLYAYSGGTATNLTKGGSVSGTGTMVHGRFGGAERVLFTNENVRAVGDLDGDGNDDLLTLNGSTLTFLRFGGASFVTAGTMQISTPNPGAVVIADFDGDGRNDIGISSDLLLLDVYRGHGGYTFDGPVSTHYERGAFHVADVTGDGKPDLIGDGPSFASVYRGRGDGTFEPERPADRLIAQDGVLAIADLDKDGVPEVIALNPGGVTIARGSHYAPMYTVLHVADFNHDGTPDLLGSDGASTYVALGQADGSYKVVPPSDPRNPIASIDQPQMVAVADVNSDGNPDLVFANPGGVTRFYGNGDGTFRAPKQFAIPSDPTSIWLADINGDGNLDVILYNSGDTTAFSYAYGDPDGNYTNPQSILQKIDPSDRGFVTDIDADHEHRPDLVTAGVFGAAIALDDEHGIFGLLPHYASDQQIAGFIAIADFDTDRRADILYDDYHQLVLRAGFGNGTFAPPIYFGAQSAPYSIIDFNGDGLLDLVAGRNLILNLGDLLFSPPRTLPLIDEWIAVNGDLIGRDGLVIRNVCPAPPQPQRRRTARH